MTKNRKIVGMVFLLVPLVGIVGWSAVRTGGVNSPFAPAGHSAERDASNVMLLNALKSIRHARRAVIENIANARTVSYKRNLVRFRDSSTVSVIRDVFQGELLKTNRSLDMAILGRGFFQVVSTNGATYYTRRGDFHTSSDGQLVLADGYVLEPVLTVPAEATRISIAGDGTVSCQNAHGSESRIGGILLTTFPNVEGLSLKGAGVFAETELSGSPVMGTPGSNGAGEIHAGFVENSNVNEREEMRILEDLVAFEGNVQHALDMVRIRQ
ncbi:MAG: flagellar hook-basal body complex protein [Planctomycetes bacterium]|nr:flagellar hook-basal body complex protein [Planctomycetota bacterium]